MVDSEYSMNIYKSVTISIGAVVKNPEMLKFVLDHLKAKKMCKHAVKKLPFLGRYVLDHYKTQQMYDKAISKNGGPLTSVPDCDKNQEICNKTVDKAVDTHLSTIQFVPECYKTQEMCYKAVNRYFSCI